MIQVEFTLWSPDLWPGLGHRATDCSLKAADLRGGPRSQRAFLGGISVEARGHGGRPLGTLRSSRGGPRYLKPHLILTLWPGCRVKTHSRGEEEGRLEEIQQKSQLSPALVCILYALVCACVHAHIACLCVPVWVHLTSQMLLEEYALFFCINVSFYDFNVVSFHICPPAEGSESDLFFFALISELLYNNSN